MKFIRKAAVLRAIGCIGAVATALGGSLAAADEGFESDQAVVELVPQANIEDINAEYGTSVIADVPARRIYLLQLPAHWDEEAFEAAIEEDERVSRAELNYLSETPEGNGQDFYFSVEQTEYPEQYAWQIINLGGGHQMATGQGVVIALLDTGMDVTHEALAGKVQSGGYNFVDSNNDIADVGNGLDDDGDLVVDEMVGHGTFLAGILAMVAPDARILPIKVLDSDGGASSFGVAQGIYYAVDQGAQIINLSVGSDFEFEFIEEALEVAREAGINVVASAGNLNIEPPEFPSNDSMAIGVAATDEDDLKSSFSNFGEEVDISAPGSDVVSTVPDDGYAMWGGTSVSTALVSGAAAVVRSVSPGITAEQAENALFASANDLDAANPQYAGLLGAGRLDIGGAVAQLCSAGCEVEARAFTVSFGYHQGGDIDALRISDDAYVVIQQQPSLSVILPLIQVDIDALAPSGGASSMTITLETATTAMPNQPSQRLSLLDQAQSVWRVVDERPTTLQDSAIAVPIDSNADAYVASDGRMDMRIGWFDPGNVFSPAWGVRIDQALWVVVR